VVEGGNGPNQRCRMDKSQNAFAVAEPISWQLPIPAYFFQKNNAATWKSVNSGLPSDKVQIVLCDKQ